MQRIFNCGEIYTIAVIPDEVLNVFMDYAAASFDEIRYVRAAVTREWWMVIFNLSAVWFQNTSNTPDNVLSVLMIRLLTSPVVFIVMHCWTFFL